MTTTLPSSVVVDEIAFQELNSADDRRARPRPHACLPADVEMNSSQGQLIHGKEEETDLMMFSFPAKLYCSQQLKETKKREIFKVTCYLLLLPSIRAEARENPPYMAAAAVCVMPRRTPRCMT